MTISIRATRLLAPALALALAGCTVGPDYVAPEFAVPDVWHAAAVEGLDDGQANLQTWWTGLGDPKLEELIKRAETANLDLRLAVARIREARARVGFASGQKMPDLEASGSASVGQQSEEGVLKPIADLTPGGFDTRELYDVGFDASWEIDVFGRIRRSVESAGAAYQASVEDYRDVLVTLFAEVARTYVDVRELQDRVSYAEANAEAQRASLRLTRDLYEEGATSEIDVRQAESNLNTTEAAIPALQIGLHFALNRLAVLLGEAPGSLDDELSAPGSIPRPAAELVAGVPAELLRQRPDLRGAERRLAAQTALIGVSKAALYPQFSLSGFFAVQATNAGDLLDGATWGISLPFRWNLFDGGRVRSLIQVEEARTEQALVVYENALLVALEEVENSLTSYALELQRRDRLARAVTALQQTFELANIQYRAGLTDFRNVLQAQRSLFVQQDNLAGSEGQRIRNLISLYKALGGGWDPDATDDS